TERAATMDAPMDARELETLLRYRRELDEIGAETEPSARIVAPPAAAASPIRRVAVFPGAFNPPTLAHVALADAARDLPFDAIFFSVGRVTLDKDDSGLLREDRLWLLCRLATRDSRFGVVVQNRGLYSEMSESMRRLLPELEDLAFIIGTDKVPQLFEPKYYDDTDARLDSLFRKARFLVAPRGTDTRAALEEILSTPPASRFADRFAWLPVPERWRGVSASLARDGWVRGDTGERHLPAEVTAFLRRSGAFADPGRYRERAAVLERSS
ncbi:MAG: hypothetical protein ACREQY_13005, partial [Candidatus Binatia bacterium]